MEYKTQGYHHPSVMSTLSAVAYMTTSVSPAQRYEYNVSLVDYNTRLLLVKHYEYIASLFDYQTLRISPSQRDEYIVCGWTITPPVYHQPSVMSTLSVW